MKPIKTRSHRKYLAYSLLDQLPPLSDASFMSNSRMRQSSLQNSKLLSTTKILAQRNHYIFIDMQQDNPIKLCQKEPSLQSSQSDEQVQKIGKYCIKDLENLSPGNRSMQKYMNIMRLQGRKKEVLRDAIKRRLSKIQPQEFQVASRKTQMVYPNGKKEGFSLTPEKKTSYGPRKLQKREQLIVKKFGIKEDYYFIDKKEPEKAIFVKPVSHKNLTKVLTAMSSPDNKETAKLPPVKLEKVPEANDQRNVQSSLV